MILSARSLAHIGHRTRVSDYNEIVDAQDRAFYTHIEAQPIEATVVVRTFSHFVRRFPLVMRLPYLVFRRFQPRFTIGVAAVVLDPAGRVLLVEHAYHPRFPWGLPGGWINHDEDPRLAVLRELREELQLDAANVRILHTAKTARNHIDMAYLCEARSPIGRLSHELLTYRWVERADLPAIKDFHRESIEAAFIAIPRSKIWENV